jgi:hypothetical protein
VNVPEDSESEATRLEALRAAEVQADALEASGPVTMASASLAALASSVAPLAAPALGAREVSAVAAPVPSAAEPVDLDPMDLEDVLELEPEPLEAESLEAESLERGALERGMASEQAEGGSFEGMSFDGDSLEDSFAAENAFAAEGGAPSVRPADASQANGFQAFLRHANLHNLLQIESLSRTTGVFLVVSGGSRGYLHLADGELVHAETGQASGEAAAAEILSWETGEFKSCARTLAPVRTVNSSVQSLLMRMAQASDEAAHGTRHHQSSRVVRRPLDQEAPTETYLPAIPAAPATPSGASPLLSPSLMSSTLVSSTLVSSSSLMSSSTTGSSTLLPPPGGSSAAATALEGLVRSVHPPRTPPPMMPPPSAAGPPSQRPSRSDPTSVADVLLSAAGEVIQGRGAATEEFAARVAYATRLAELIGRAIRSGTPKGLELRGKSTQTIVQWQADGTLSASLDLAQPPSRR